MKYTPLDDRLYEYILSTSLRDSDLFKDLRAETATYIRSNMQIAPEQGQFMALLIKLIGAQKALEIGVFTGYSSLSVALALPEDGKLIACDISRDYTKLARQYWEKAGVAHKVTLHIGPALETLDRLLSEAQANTFDFAFIDADKTNYDGYYERSLQLVRSGGLIVIDNVLWSGRVADPEDTDDDTVKLRALNQKLQNDERVDLSLIPVADGLTLVRKR